MKNKNYILKALAASLYPLVYPAGRKKTLRFLSTFLLARVRAMRLLHQINTTTGQALALNRNALVNKFGHLVSLLWAKLILSRFRDVVLHLPFEAATNAAEVPNDEDPLHFFGSCRSAYRGRNVPGA